MIQVPHRDYSVPPNIEPEQHGWIATIPLAREGSWLFIYNDELTEKKLVHIPFGAVFTMRSDVYHGGCLGSMGNFRIQISFVVHHMAEYYRELGHVKRTICIDNGIFDTEDVNINCALSLVNQDTTNDLTVKAKKIEDNYIFGSSMWPSVGEVHGKN